MSSENTKKPGLRRFGARMFTVMPQLFAPATVGVAVAGAIFQAAGTATPHVGIASGITPAFAVAGVAALTGADPSGFHAILDFREGKRQERKLDIEAVLHSYLEFVEVVTNEVDRRLDAL